jgi:hypothetical protein
MFILMKKVYSYSRKTTALVGEKSDLSDTMSLLVTPNGCQKQNAHVAATPRRATIWTTKETLKQQERRK